jgi:hypothetical protein
MRRGVWLGTMAAALVANLAVAQTQPRPAQPAPPQATAAPGQPGWSADAGTQCRVWNANPQPGETVQWSGGCTGGMASGSGTLEWRYQENGEPRVDRYVGAMRDGRRNGRGVLTDASARYEGEFRDGRQNGLGVLTDANARYEGEFRDGRQNGRGVLTDASGRYEGEFRDGRQNGRGVLTDAEGRDEGEYRDGRQNGRGVLTWAIGDRYEGEFRDGHADGYGEGYIAGTWYRGTWVGGCFRLQNGGSATIGRTAAECR